MTDATEKTIISEVLSGQTEQFRFLVERYHRGLILHLYNLTNDQQMAEDIAQEAFIRAYNKLNLFDKKFAFSTWLYKIASNIAYRQLKQIKKTEALDTVAELIPDDRPQPSEIAESAITHEAVRRSVDTLPIVYRQVITLYYWDNLSYEEIADLTGRPVGTIRTWLYRAKEDLRKELHGQV